METKSAICLDTTATAAHLGVKLSTLAAWRVRGGGPRYAKLNRMVRYRLSDLEEWLDARGQENTGQK